MTQHVVNWMDVHSSLQCITPNFCALRIFASSEWDEKSPIPIMTYT
jgi:hypothetical protein